MYDFSEGFAFKGLLEHISGAAVAVEDGCVADYNEAAKALIPELREGQSVKGSEAGLIVGGAEFSAVCYKLPPAEVYVFAETAAPPEENIPAMLENISMSLLEPLNTAFAASDLLGAKLDEADESTQKYFRILRHAQYRILHTADILREMSAMQSPYAPASEMFDICALCADLAATANALVRDRALKLVFELLPFELFIYSDRARIEKVLLEILANSIAHCGEGDSVTLSLSVKNRSILIVVEDDGGGIDPDILPNVFSAYSVPPELSGGPRGAGLGLAAARIMLNRLGGQIVIDSDKKTGKSRAVIVLPYVKPEKTEFRTSSTEYAPSSMRPVLSAFASFLGDKYFGPPYLQ